MLVWDTGQPWFQTGNGGHGFKKVGGLRALESRIAAKIKTGRQIQQAVGRLSSDELLILREWFSLFDAAAWDKQFQDDVTLGRLDTLADEALRDLLHQLCRPF